MSFERYEVRAAPSFFEDLDRQLRNERGPNGEPSTTDFQTFELLSIVERFRRASRIYPSSYWVGATIEC